MGRKQAIRIVVMGAGFWSRYQIAAWKELKGAAVVALYNRTRSKAEALAREFGITAVYDDAGEMLRREKPDAIDIITAVETHAAMVRLAARHGIPVICQKPMATSLREAEGMVAACRRARVPFYVHENWRWQRPIRELKKALSTGAIVRVFRARVDFITGFPVFENQPFLRELKQFILTDMGSHILDTARFLFGEASQIYCQTQRVHRDIKGEDVATVVIRMASGASVVCNMAYAENYIERERFPETLIFVEGERGSIELGPGFWLRVTTRAGTHARRYPPPRYAWADPAYDLVQSSIVPCNRNLLGALAGRWKAETTGEDNLRTVRLVFGAYESAGRNVVIDPNKL